MTRTNLSSFLSLILNAFSCFESDLVLLSFLFSLLIPSSAPLKIVKCDSSVLHHRRRWEEKAVRFTLTVFLKSCDSQCAVTLPHIAVG